ncbi:MAG: cytochrome c [SAR324 cluster bacterium]|nr:cytochrome c [SAR324 cluster bacterium]MBF0351617.1 cytochrome c [SAR324 cluster bacterium]
MLKMNKLNKILMLAISFSFVGNLAWAGKNNPFDDPRTKEPGYNLKNDASPWFDGKDYPFFQDMFNGKSIKPQEEGTYQNFPSDSVPVRFELGKIQQIYESFVPMAEREIRPLNPTTATEASVANGRKMYNIYCAVCHAKDGNGNTPVVEKGMPAIPIAGFVQIFSETHFYNKIRYGSKPAGIMPAYGALTTRQERWDIVNYLKSPQFGKEEN